MTIDDPHTGGDSDARKAGATVKRTTSDFSHSPRDGNARQAGATVERMPSNIRYTSVVGDHAFFAADNQCFASSCNKAISLTVISRISFFNLNARQAGAIDERR